MRNPFGLSALLVALTLVACSRDSGTPSDGGGDATTGMDGGMDASTDAHALPDLTPTDAPGMDVDLPDGTQLELEVIGSEDELDDNEQAQLDEVLARDPSLKVQLYGKSVVPGRKVGHVTACSDDLAEALRRGLILLSCGVYANVIRILVPLTASDAVLEELHADVRENCPVLGLLLTPQTVEGDLQRA